MISVSYFLLITFILISENNFKEHSYCEDYANVIRTSSKLERKVSEFPNKIVNDILANTINIEAHTISNSSDNTLFEYELDGINFFMKRSNTITDCLLYVHFCQYYIEYVHYKNLSNSGNSQTENNLIISHYLYLAKCITRQPFQSEPYVCIKSCPKSSIMISLMLLICGDTGTLINPGPVNRNVPNKCSICESNIRHNSRYISCIECKASVHKKCVAPSHLTMFQCNLCTYKILPFNNVDLNYGLNSSITNSSFMNLNNNSQINFDNKNNYDCFAKKGLHFIHANVRSIFHKMSDLKIIAKHTNAAVIGITETWLDSSYTDSCVSIDGYNLIRRDRDGHAGGVCAYIREDLTFNIRQDLNNPDLEDLWFEILLKKSKPFYVGICYRTNNNNKFLDCLDNTITKLRSDCDFLILGDINICLKKNKSKLCKDYMKLLRLFGCKQIIESPTRITESCSSLLDHIITNNSDKIYQSGVLDIGLSDHLITFCSRKIIRGQIGKHNTIQIRSLKNYSVHLFLSKLRNVDWSIVTTCSDVNEAWYKFKTIFSSILDEVAPIKNVRIKTRTEPWINSMILELIWKRDRLLHESNKNKHNKELRKEFNLIRNKVQREIRLAKTNYFRDKIEENKGNSKGLWRQLKTIGFSSKSKNNCKIVLDIDNESCFEPKTITEHMNNYFLNIPKNLVNLLPSPSKIYSTCSESFKHFYLNNNLSPNEFILKHITENFVNTELTKLNANKSYGIDGIQARFIKDSASEINAPIAYIINLSIDTNVVPTDFKFARVKPLYKKGSMNKVENYRPISILSVVSKVLEKAIYFQFEKYLKDKKILYCFQSGFRKNHSTDTCLINLMDYLHTNISEGKYVGMVLLDLQKAFDTVDHDILCNKLKVMGVGCLEWFESYLKNRQQVVTLDGINSTPGFVQCGVPQGSILGPLLFLCYINDMPISIKCKLLLYADDSALLVSGFDPNSIATQLSQELKSCYDWLIDNKLSLHLGKTESILFSTKRKNKINNNFQVFFNTTPITNVNSVKYLGLNLDCTLSGESIVSTITKKATSRLKFLYRYNSILKEQSKKILCSALIQSHLDYCCSSWYTSLNKLQKKRLQVLQNKFIRFILDLGPRAHIGSAEFIKVNMLPVSDRVRQLKLNHVFRIINDQCPGYLKENFSMIKDTQLSLCTRASLNNFFLPRVKNQASHSFYFSAIKEWNSLPSKIKENKSDVTFKLLIRDHLFKELQNKESCEFIYYV